MLAAAIIELDHIASFGCQAWSIKTVRGDRPWICATSFTGRTNFEHEETTGSTESLDTNSLLNQTRSRGQRRVSDPISGIRPNEYYELTAKKKKLEIEKAVFEQDRAIVCKARDKLKLQPEFSGLELSAEEHEKAINDLLVRLRSLLTTRQTRAMELADILDQRAGLDQQIAMVQASANELAEDATWAADQADEIMCPTCGVVHANDFRNRFAILADREECFEFLSSAQQKRQDGLISRGETDTVNGGRERLNAVLQRLGGKPLPADPTATPVAPMQPQRTAPSERLRQELEDEFARLHGMEDAAQARGYAFERFLRSGSTLGDWTPAPRSDKLASRSTQLRAPRHSLPDRS
ncbi:hypothetical protein M728_002206 [Ensifer sp. WSM1721]|uniref:hypothetical protein n=1 Tax=Ensifer sp. WSM1721 TaxID=1041159 RepID=UPI00047DDAC3|nr:hypothetical protein [Ensifer sp. WSM1721]